MGCWHSKAYTEWDTLSGIHNTNKTVVYFFVSWTWSDYGTKHYYHRSSLHRVHSTIYTSPPYVCFLCIHLHIFIIPCSLRRIDVISVCIWDVTEPNSPPLPRDLNSESPSPLPQTPRALPIPKPSPLPTNPSTPSPWHHQSWLLPPSPTKGNYNPPL